MIDGFLCTWQASSLHVLADGAPCDPDSRYPVVAGIIVWEGVESGSCATEELGSWNGNPGQAV
jgi:hypothetical protein